MKKKTFLLTAIALFVPAMFVGGCSCSGSKESVTIENDLKDTHYLKFIENNSEVLRLVVLEGETYDDLLPYFPTLTQEEGYIKYWDGDYTYTDYSKENQFKVWDSSDLIIDIYAYSRKIS